MNNITPEHLVTVTQGATPAQIITLVVLGIIAFGFIFAFGKWVIDLKLGTLPQDLKDIQKSLDTLKSDMVRLDAKLWTEADIQQAMSAAIKAHIENCPFHQKER